VWGCDVHYAGDFVASCSMDNTIRVFDLLAGRCRDTLRGHVDSVNAMAWMPFSANIASASGDKTLSIWDARAGGAVQAFYGHGNSVYDLAVSLAGDTIVSCDADGTVKVWDVRKATEVATVNLGNGVPIHKIVLDRSALRAIAACDDGQIRVVHLDSYTVGNALRGRHEGPCTAVALAPNDAFLVTGSADFSFRVWG
jgi:WD40 repeat protein